MLAQDFEVPKDLKLEKAEDYKVYESDIINAIDWLMETPLDKEPNKRKQVNLFVITWLTGSPSVSIEIKGEITDFGDCADCLMAFMGGWTKYSLENEYSKDQVKGNTAGIKSVIAFYEKNKKTIGKIKPIKKYAKLLKKGKLEAHIRKKMEKK